MTMFNSLLSGLGSLAATLLPQVVSGAGPVIKAAEALSHAFSSIKTLNGGTAPADAEANHDALMKRVMEHADATFDRAEGG